MPTRATCLVPAGVYPASEILHFKGQILSPLLGPLDHQPRPRHDRPLDRLGPVLRALPRKRQPLPGLSLDRPGLDRRGLRGAQRAVQGLRRRAHRRRAAHLRPRPQAPAERHVPQGRAAGRGAAVAPRGVLPAVPRAAAAAAGLDARDLHQRRAGRHLVRPAHPAAAGRRHRGDDRAAPVPAERDRRRLLHQVQHRLAAARRLRGALARATPSSSCAACSRPTRRAPSRTGTPTTAATTTACRSTPRRPASPSPRAPPVPAADKVKGGGGRARAPEAARNLRGRRGGALRRGHHGPPRRRPHRPPRASKTRAAAGRPARPRRSPTALLAPVCESALSPRHPARPADARRPLRRTA